MLPLLLCALLAYVTASSGIFPEDVCIGANYTLPMYFHPPLYNRTVVFTPKGGESRVVFNNRQSLDPRFKLNRRKLIEMAAVSEREDEATLTVEKHLFSTVMLRVKNCRSVVQKLCGGVVFWNVPADAEYLEFSGPDVDSPPSILWNRSSRSSVRGALSGALYQIQDLTQRDSGYYRFRGRDDLLLKFDTIQVKVNTRSYVFDEGKIELEYPLEFTPAKVTLLRPGAWVTQTLTESDKLKITDRYLQFQYAVPNDSGTYEFFDKDGNLILQITLEVKEVEKYWVGTIGSVILSGLISSCCCYCLRRSCCSGDSDKSGDPETEAESATPPAVFNHGTQTSQPDAPLLPPEPGVGFPDPPSYSETKVRVDPPPPYEECIPQSPAAPPATSLSVQSSGPGSVPPATSPSVQSSGPGPAEAPGTPLEPAASGASTFPVNGLDFGSDSEPRYEPSVLPSAPLLSADSSTSAEYNFL